MQKIKKSSRPTKIHETKSDWHENSRRIDWEHPRCPKMGLKSFFVARNYRNDGALWGPLLKGTSEQDAPGKKRLQL